MSPEQAAGKRAVPASDQFSLGTILYEMVTGRRAWKRSTAAETLTAIIREDPAADRERGARHAHGSALDHRPLPRQGPGGALWLDPRSRPRPGDAPGPSRRAERRGSARRGRRRARSEAPRQAASWSSPSRAPRSSARPFSCRRRSKGRPRPTGLGSDFDEASSGPAGLLPTARRSSTARHGTAARSRMYSTRTPSTETRTLDLPPGKLLAISRSNELAFLRDVYLFKILRSARHPREGRSGSRHGTRHLRERAGGRLVSRWHAARGRPQGQGKRTAGIPARQDALRDGSPDQQHANIPRWRVDRLLRGGRRGHRVGRSRFRRPETRPVRRLVSERHGTRLVRGRQGDLVHSAEDRFETAARRSWP